jgi:hypothetical protein
VRDVVVLNFASSSIPWADARILPLQEAQMTNSSQSG